MITVQKQPPVSEPMGDILEIIKLDLLSEYERSGQINIAEWVKRHPEHREELIDFWVWLKGTRSSANEPPAPSQLSPSDVEVYKRALNDACLAVTLGRAWLRSPVDPESAELGTLAKDLEAVRSKAGNPRSQHLAFRKAVVCTWVVSRLQQKRSRVTRLAAQKVTYLLEQAMSLGVFVEHDRKPLGPYDHRSRYADAEPIARRKGWLQIAGTTLRANDDLSALMQFLPRYVRSENVAQRLVDCLARYSDDELETVATVHWIARELEDARLQVNVESVKHALARTPEWEGKLARPNFSASRLGDALSFLAQLRLISPQPN